MNDISVFDFHSHILPKADHGCGSGKEAVRQLELLRNAGIGNVVATPHFYPNRHSVKDFIKLVDNAADELFSVLDPEKPRPHIAIGAEVLVCENIHKMDDFEKLCIRGTDTLLLELPMTSGEWSNGIFDTVCELLRMELNVVLAHIDRYLPNHKNDIAALLDMGAYAQINAISVKSFRTKKHIKPFLTHNGLCGFGTDMHGEDKAAADAFAALGEHKLLKNGMLERIMERSEALLEGARFF